MSLFRTRRDRELAQMAAAGWEVRTETLADRVRDRRTTRPARDGSAAVPRRERRR